MAQLDTEGSAFVARCPRCATLLDADAARCGSCGADLRSMLVELVVADGVPPLDRRRRSRTPIGRRVGWAVLAVVTAIAGWAGVVAGARGLRGCRPLRTGGAGSLPFIDRCTGTRLVLGRAHGLDALDLDAGRTVSVEDPRIDRPDAVVATDALSRDHVALLEGGEAFSVPLRGSGVIDLGPALSVLPDGTGGWWVIAPGGPHGPPGSVARRAVGDRAGLGPPLFLGAGVTPVGGVSDGLVVSNGGNALAVVGGPRPGPVHTPLAVERVVGGDHDNLVVVAADPSGVSKIWIVDVADGAARIIGPAGTVGEGAGGVPGAKFSPDGRHLAVLLYEVSATGYRSDALAIVDVKRGTVSFVPGGGTASDHPALAWSPDGRWVFFLQAGGPVGRTIGAFHLGDTNASALRYYPERLVDLFGVRA